MFQCSSRVIGPTRTVRVLSRQSGTFSANPPWCTALTTPMYIATRCTKDKQDRPPTVDSYRDAYHTEITGKVSTGRPYDLLVLAGRNA